MRTGVERYEYDAYGNCHVLEPNYAPDPDGLTDYSNPYLFTGRAVDILDNSSLKIQYNRNRYYDQYTGRWTTHDLLGYMDGMNLYEWITSHGDPHLLLSSASDPKGAVVVVSLRGLTITQIAAKLHMSVEAVAAVLGEAVPVATTVVVGVGVGTVVGTIPGHTGPPSLAPPQGLPSPVPDALPWPPEGLYWPVPPIGWPVPRVEPLPMPWVEPFPIDAEPLPLPITRVEECDLAPPGDCSKPRHAELQLIKDFFCDKKRTCKNVSLTPGQIQERIRNAHDCITARRNVMNDCFRGGDLRHRRELRRVFENLWECREALKKATRRRLPKPPRFPPRRVPRRGAS